MPFEVYWGERLHLQIFMNINLFIIMIFLVSHSYYVTADVVPVLTIESSKDAPAVEPQPIQIGVADYPPYEYSHQGDITGLSVLVIKEAFKRMKVPYEMKLYPWTRALMMLKEGTLDALSGVYFREDRLSYLDYSKEILREEELSLFVTEDSDIEFTGDLSALYDYHFGIIKNYSYGSNFDSAVAQKKISKLLVEIEVELLLLELCTGKIDIFIAEYSSTTYIAKRIERILQGSIKRCKYLKVLTPPVQKVPVYLVFSKIADHQQLLAHFDATLREMKEDGTFQQIIDDWDTLDYPQLFAPTNNNSDKPPY